MITSRISGAWEAALEATGPVLTAATAFSLIRVFEGDGWVLPVYVAAAISHLLAIAIRRIGWGMLVSALASGVGLVLTVTWSHYWSTVFWGIPAGNTWAELGGDLEQAWTVFGELSPPVKPSRGVTGDSFEASAT